jgi:hypothetical protein
VYTRKAQFQYGWDWDPSLNTMGIIKPVYLGKLVILKLKMYTSSKKLYTPYSQSHSSNQTFQTYNRKQTQFLPNQGE